MTNRLGDLFGNLSQPVPKTDGDWIELEFLASDIFSPHAPIDDQTLFAGRSEMLTKVVETVFQRGRHVILYGERGVGKTSLANIIKDQVFHKSRVIKVIKRSCTKSHDFRLMWQHALDDYTLEGKTSEQFLGPEPNPYDIYKILDMLPKTERPIFIFDEFDRITDRSVFPVMADTVKYLADYGSRATIIIVGVADSVAELFGGHPSIQRNIQQIKMPRMSPSELRDIFARRMPLLGMDIANRVVDLTVELSQGLPTYTHLLGQNATLSAVRRRSMDVQTDDFNRSVEICVEDADEMVKEGYLKAVRSTKPNNNYREALLACALAATDEKGYFSAADIRAPFSRIKGRAMGIPDYARHLRAFCEEDRGPALIKQGNPKSYQYRFADPLVRPYAIIRGIVDGMVRNPPPVG